MVCGEALGEKLSDLMVTSLDLQLCEPDTCLCTPPSKTAVNQREHHFLEVFKILNIFAKLLVRI